MKKILYYTLSSIVLSSMVSVSIAGTLTTDLYRSGNSSSARMDNIRIGKDVETFTKNGETWVKAKGGISTFGYELNDKNVWKAPRGTQYPDDIRVINDNPITKHWSWQPAKEMPLSRYTQLMVQMNTKFQKVPTKPKIQQTNPKRR